MNRGASGFHIGIGLLIFSSATLAPAQISPAPSNSTPPAPQQSEVRLSAETQPPGDVVYPTAAVATDHALASQAGLEILQKGGNAVDAAVAASFALSVTRPYSCGVGGGGFMVIRLAPTGGKPAFTTAINYRETCPAGVDKNYFEKVTDEDAATHGGKAVAIPGHVAGMLYALEKYGRLDRATVLAPAIRLAKQGFNADAHYVENTQKDTAVIPWLKADASRRERFAWLWERCLHRGEIKVGGHVAMTEQARLFEAIVERGAAGFYEGPVAEAMVRAVQRDGGALTLDDLRGYKVDEVAPFVSTFQGRTIVSMPPPSSGGIVLAQVFAMLEDRPADLAAAVRAGHNSVPYIHLITEASKHAFADRARWLGDTNFVDVPVKGLLAPAYLRSRADSIRLDGILPHESYGTATPPASPTPDDHGTSHLCVIDKDGNAVACTETINLIFGSLLAVPEYGFVLNDTMDDFLTRAGHANAFGLSHADRNRPQPGKRPLSSMTPTIAVNANGTVELIAGGAGGPRIISGTLQTTLNVLLFDQAASAAVANPRFHHQWEPDRLDLEPELRGGDVEKSLQALGHTTSLRKAVANVQIIRRVQGGWQPASDPRKGGVPAGY